MAKWICIVCGYRHNGEEAPERCPQCGAPASKFYRKRENGMSIIAIVAILLGIGAILFSIFTCRASTAIDNSTVQSLDINQFMGKWYEIARFDHRFERGMQQVCTMYTIEKDGTIKVVNQGLKKDKMKTSEGKGKLTSIPGLLRVSFWGPFYSDYRIMMLAPDYTYALIGGKDEDYLWILSRTPKMQQDTKNMLIHEAQRRGYNTNNLIWVEQKGMEITKY